MDFARSRNIAPIGLALGCLLVLGACRSKPDAKLTAELPDALSQAAYETYVRYVKDCDAQMERSSEEIAERYWTDGIKGLQPIKVYTHRINIVVVQELFGNTERGKYFYIPVSSYLPRTGDDGFEFSRVGDGVYNYERRRTN